MIHYIIAPPWVQTLPRWVFALDIWGVGGGKGDLVLDITGGRAITFCTDVISYNISHHYHVH